MKREEIIESMGWHKSADASMSDMIVRIEEIVQAAAREEREACIRLVENEAECYSEPVWALEIVSDIRARGEK